MSLIQRWISQPIDEKSKIGMEIMMDVLRTEDAECPIWIAQGWRMWWWSGRLVAPIGGLHIQATGLGMESSCDPALMTVLNRVSEKIMRTLLLAMGLPWIMHLWERIVETDHFGREWCSRHTMNLAQQVDTELSLRWLRSLAADQGCPPGDRSPQEGMRVYGIGFLAAGSAGKAMKYGQTLAKSGGQKGIPSIIDFVAHKFYARIGQ
ncbi:uncharacterized protein CIMG_12656 [Coccidioides immitis RS]|uniref:Uncharacterized protein n=1 Tax=Coccidioides immitis (strain RS) TaxID=246410 RepID=A0A0E1RZ91_COCIM|nr:uncharacterized protein CIMG_12656 [Coccidioides immitis RS]EAS37210.2 hypothetical protein CIMG_12656 [Coccidioides immitis RS]